MMNEGNEAMRNNMSLKSAGMCETIREDTRNEVKESCDRQWRNILAGWLSRVSGKMKAITSYLHNF